MSAADDFPAKSADGGFPSSGGVLPVVGSGPGWLVVEKPCGMSIHNEPGYDLRSVVQDGLRQGCVPGLGRPPVTVHAVHRLDRDTSGIVLLAADPDRLSFFGDQFAAREVRKRYFALVHGRMDNGTDDRFRMAWTWPLTTAAGGRKDPRGNGPRLPCMTRWRTRERSDHFTLIECQPETGRKHQIRRHAKLAGHPVAGDRRYGSARSRDYLWRHFKFNRLGLHAHSLTIRVPGQTQPVTFCSAGLPPAMRRLLDADR